MFLPSMACCDAQIIYIYIYIYKSTKIRLL